jgi:hypothetical protein
MTRFVVGYNGSQSTLFPERLDAILTLRLIQSNNCRTTALEFFAEKFASCREKTVGTRKYFSGTPISLAGARGDAPDPF